MKDFLQKYHKRKIIGNSLLILGAFIFALSINFLIIDGTNFGKNLKASVLDSGEKKAKADLFLENDNGNINLKSGNNINNLENLSLSFTYNPEDIKIENIKSNLGEIDTLGEKNNGILSIVLNANGKTIQKNENILNLKVKNLKEKSSGINILNGNFTDKDGEKFELTTSGIVFK